jgi:hypothetical protein
LIRKQQSQFPDLEEKLAEMEQAAQDKLFLADMNEIMNDFKYVDAEWQLQSE